MTTARERSPGSTSRPPRPAGGHSSDASWSHGSKQVTISDRPQLLRILSASWAPRSREQIRPTHTPQSLRPTTGTQQGATLLRQPGHEPTTSHSSTVAARPGPPGNRQAAVYPSGRMGLQASRGAQRPSPHSWGSRRAARGRPRGLGLPQLLRESPKAENSPGLPVHSEGKAVERAGWSRGPRG